MSKNIFVNMVVNDLERSKAFFTNLGWTFNPQFTDEKAACLVISEHIYAMLILPEFFKTFTKKELIDPTKSIETILALSCESKDEVDQIADKALANGGSMANDPQALDFMYSRSFFDPDGHMWEVLWMDPSFVQKNS